MQTMGFLSSDKTVKSSTDHGAIVPEHFTHAHAVGQTGCGKTTSFIYPNLLSRIKMGHSILLYDFKGKEHMSLKYLAKQEGRLDDVLEVGKPWGAKINLMRLMDRKSLDLFLKNITASSQDNQYWAKAASKLFLSVYDVIVILEKISIYAKELEWEKEFTRTLHMSETIDLEEFDYPRTLSFKSIMPICQSEQNVSTFVNHLKRLQKKMDKFYLNIVKDNKESEFESPEILEKYRSFILLLVQLKRVIKSSQISLASFMKVDDTNPKLSIVMTLLPLVDVANKVEFNSDDVDLLKALDDKKMISINAKDLSNELLESMTYALFNEFSKRSMLMEVQPISVFIDEAQRVITKNQDHNLDVLRECRVEMFLAYQNAELMENHLGENEYKALMKNLTSSFYFTNLAYHKENDLSTLKPFECLMSQDNYLQTHNLEPLFLDKKGLYEVENRYLSERGVFSAFGLEAFSKDGIVLFDGRLFEENKIIVYDLKSKCSSIEEIVTPEDVEAIKDELKSFAFLIGEEEREAQEAKDLEEMFDDDYLTEYLEEEEAALEEIHDVTMTANKSLLAEMEKTDKEDDAA